MALQVNSSNSVPHSCPGVESEEAGKADGCRGCPNRGICSTGALSAGPDPDVAEIGRRLFAVRHIVLVISGKGGVGKSTVAANLARFLATEPNVNVGLLDVDICGPSIPKLMGLEDEQVHQSASGWSPIYVDDNLAVMSCGFLLNSHDDAVIWRGPKKNGLIKQFLKDVDWGELDYLVVDTPPGTSDEHLSLVSYLKSCSQLEGCVLVTTPQEISLLDVRKQIDFCRRVDLKILGLVENMSAFVCHNCHRSSTIFSSSSGGATTLAADYEIPFLGSIPIDPAIGRTCDEGSSLFDETDIPLSSTAVKTLKEIGTKLLLTFKEAKK